MTTHTTMAKTSRLEVIETGSRRRWTVEEKLRIVSEGLSVPRNVSATARRHGLRPGQLFTWCQQARDGRLTKSDDAPGFVAAIVAPEGTPNDPYSGVRHPGSSDGTTDCKHSGRMVIVLAGMRQVIVGSDVDSAALRRVVDVLEGR
jgi:transposase